MKNKKNILLFIGVILLLFILFILLYFKSLKPFKLNDNKIIGIIEIYKNKNLVNKYVNEDDIDKIEIGGYEEYIIIPRNKRIKMNVYKLTMNDTGNFNKEFVKSINQAFYLKCNESDLFSNVLIEIEYKNQKYEYSPYISLKDGTLILKKFVLKIDK